MVSKSEVSSLNSGIRDLLKKVKINYNLLLLTFTSKRELHVRKSIKILINYYYFSISFNF
jgi:hypothetical protein